MKKTTLEDLKRQVEWFGRGDVINDRYTLIALANKALHELYLTIPVTKTVRLNVRGHKPTVYYEELVSKSGKTMILPLVGKAYSMRVMGKGNYTITDGSNVSAVQFDTENETKLVRGFIGTGGTIKFWGSFNFIIYDFSLYDEIFSQKVESIPDGAPIAVYDIRAKYGDFLSFLSPPTDRFGKVINDCRLQDGRLEINSGYSGEILITYRRLPTEIIGLYEEQDAEEVVDISNEYSHLLIYLIWYHYWHLNDEVKAQSFRDRFESLASVLANDRLTIDRKYVNENGWA